MSDPTPSAFAPGVVFADYRIGLLLGRGGMGEVYEVEHIHLGRRKALKVLPEGLANDPEFRERFRHEARVLANLEHPHIVEVDHASESDGRFYIVMELLAGSLAQALAEAARAPDRSSIFGPGRVIEILRQVLSALVFAHGKGVIHRDLKPGNVLLDARGVVRLSDFGVARAVGNEFLRTLAARRIDPEARTRVAGVERASGENDELVGTVDYIAPEVRAGLEADARSDLFALGVITYEMLTGRKPLGRYRDASAIVRGLDSRWDLFINGALEPEARDRWPDAAAMAAALEELAAAPKPAAVEPVEPPKPPPPPPSTPPTPAPHPAAPATDKPRVVVPPPLPRAGVRSGLPTDGQPWTLRDLHLDLVWIPPGRFTMGSPPSEIGRDPDEGPATQVTLTRGFWLGRHEVTQAQWQALMGGNPSRFKAAGPDAPVEQVSWNDAMEYCRRLTERERAASRLPEGFICTLPTEAQWEHACRAGTSTPHACAGDVSAMAWIEENSGATTHPVGQKPPNAWGLHDMHGNVWEWCRDGWGAYPGGAVIDPSRPPAATDRVYRGGGWNRGARFCRSAYRSRFTASMRYGHLGFRLALVPEPR